MWLVSSVHHFPTVRCPEEVYFPLLSLREPGEKFSLPVIDPHIAVAHNRELFSVGGGFYTGVACAGINRCFFVSTFSSPRKRNAFQLILAVHERAVWSDCKRRPSRWRIDFDIKVE